MDNCFDVTEVKERYAFAGTRRCAIVFDSNNGEMYACAEEDLGHIADEVAPDLFELDMYGERSALGERYALIYLPPILADGANKIMDFLRNYGFLNGDLSLGVWEKYTIHTCSRLINTISAVTYFRNMSGLTKGKTDEELQVMAESWWKDARSDDINISGNILETLKMYRELYKCTELV